jgi:hypothetical protein
LATKSNPTKKEKLAANLTISIDGPYGLAHDFSHLDTLILVAGGIGITPCKAIFESLRASYLNASQSSSTHNRVPRRVHLVWVLRDISLAAVMKDTLEEFVNLVGPFSELQPFSIQLYAPTPCPPGEDDAKRGDDPTNCHCNILAPLILHRRPNLTEELPLITQPATTTAAIRRNALKFPPPLLSPSLYQDLEAGSHTPASSPLSSPRNTNRNGNGNDASAGSSKSHNDTMLFVCGPDRMTAECEKIAHQQKWEYHTEIFDL